MLGELMDYDDKPIVKALKEERYKDAIKLIRAAQKISPNSHWLWACLSTSYYELHQYALAVKYGWNAINIAPNCPLTIWYYGTALDMLGRRRGDKGALDAAELTFKGLLGFGWRYMAFVDPCGEGESQAKALLNDARYRLALIYWHRKDYKTALRWAKLHLRMRTKGQKSIYTKKLVTADIAKIEKEMAS